jgi:predicted Zn-dependent protease
MTILDSGALLETILEKARQHGADHAAAVLSEEKRGSIRFAANRVTQHKTHENATVNLAVAVDGKEAIIRTNLLQNDNLEHLAKKAVLYAQNAPENPEFFEPIGMQKYTETQAWFESTARLGVGTRADVIKEICGIAEAENVNLYGNLDITRENSAVANTKGLFVEQPATEISLSLSTRTRRFDGSSQAHVWERDWSRFRYRETVERSIRVARQSARPTALDPGTFTVILSPKAISEYLMFLVFSLDARMADKGQSFFGKASNSSRLGDTCFQDTVTLKSVVDHSDLPMLKFGGAFGTGGSRAGMLFSMGLPARTVEWIEHGIVKNLQYSPFYARQKNLEPVAAPPNLYMQGGTATLDELISGIERGLLIESFWYVNPIDWNRLELTGLTRDGVFLIEHGRISRPVHNFRFNDSPVSSLNRITGMTPPEKTFGEYLPGMFPWVRINGFHMSSVSHAV